MQTLTREQAKIVVPEKIQDKINERWFYLYEFITPKEVKSSIERDYLKILSFIALPLWTISIILWIIIFPLFLTVIWVTFWFIILYLIFLAIKRSIKLINISNIVLTDKAISIWWKIIKNEDLEKEKYFIEKHEREFDEKLFGDSNLKNVGFSLLNEVMNKIWKLFWWIIEHSNNIRTTVFLILLAIVYVWVISWVYFVWIFIIWIFWLLIMAVNKAILKITWQKVFKINNLFDQIDKSSDNLINSKNELSLNLINATENKWQDWLLNNINSWIEKINFEANSSVQNIIKLRKTLENSKYKDIFNFDIYNSWIKRQIYTPIKQIIELLETNLEILKHNKEKVEKQITQTNDISLQWPLLASKTRIDMNIIEIEKHISQMNIYLDKLK